MKYNGVALTWARFAVYVAIQMIAKRHQARFTNAPPCVRVAILSMLKSANKLELRLDGRYLRADVSVR